jgi:hypothetical protein
LSVPHARGYLLLRRDGGLWGIANSAVDGLARRGADFRIAISAGAGSDGSDAGELWADEIVGVVEELRVWPVASVVNRFWPEAAAGLAVHGREPVVVVDPRRPPSALRSQGEDRLDEGRD